MEVERIVSGGLIVDGTGGRPFAGDVGIERGRIAAIAAPGQLRGRETLDARGRVVAPGFIDVHSHADWVLPHRDHDAILAPLVLQGVTTVVAGNCGFSPAPVTDDSISRVEGSSEILREEPLEYAWRTVREFLDVLATRGLLLNAAMLVGHGTLRHAAVGRAVKVPTEAELSGMRSLLLQSLRDGAFGLSLGLAYEPGVFAGTSELVALARATAEVGGVLAVHGRAYSWISPAYRPMLLTVPHNLRSVRELLDLARSARVRLQLSHQIFIGRRTWPTHRVVLRAIDRALQEGVDVAFDAFPYTAGNTTINALFPDWVLADFAREVRRPRTITRLRREFAMFRTLLGLEYRDIRLLWAGAPDLAELEGLDFAEIGVRLGRDPFEGYMHLARESGGKARILIGTYSGEGDDEAPLRAVLSHPLCAIETDTILTVRGKPNPASFGTFPRVLGRYARDLSLFSLQEAVRRMTSLSAERIGLSEVGRLAPGFAADLVVFDAATVGDNTAPDRTDAPPSGIFDVLVSGEVVVRGGALVGGVRAGRVLRS